MSNQRSSLTEKVAGYWRLRIENNRIPEGGLLPSEKDLAERHGVSRVTVRRALTLLAEEGRIMSRAGVGWQVLQADIEMAPTSAARGTIGIALPVYACKNNMLTAIRQTLDHHGYPSRAIEVERKSGTLFEDLHTDNFDGMICYSGMRLPDVFLQRAAAANIPVVNIGSVNHQPYDCVASDTGSGFQELVNYFVNLGHEHISFVSADVLVRNDAGFILREQGYTRAMRLLNREPDALYLPENVIYSDEDKDTLWEWFSDRSANRHRPTVILATTFVLARDIFLILSKHHIRVPEDVIIFGFEPEVQYQFLDTHGIHDCVILADPAEEMGRTAANRIVSRLSGDTSPPHLSLLQPRILNVQRGRQWAPAAEQTEGADALPKLLMPQ